MFSISAFLLYVLFFAIGWLVARWRGAQQSDGQFMAPVAETPKPKATPTPASTGGASKASTVSSAVKEPVKPAAAPPAAKKPEPKPVPKPESKPVAAKTGEAAKEPKTTKSAKPAKVSKPAKPAKAASKPIVSSDPSKPERLAAARDGQADDLKRVKGIGPANEKKLNAFGIYHFDQVANWTAAQAEWIGKELSFPGRIEREDWIEQAKVLASGGDTEFSKRSDKP